MAGRPHAGQLRPGVPTAQLHQPPRWFQVSDYPPLLYLVRIAQAHSLPAGPQPRMSLPKSPQVPPTTPPPIPSRLAELGSRRKSQAPQLPQLHHSSGCLWSRLWPLLRQLVFHMLLFSSSLSFSSDSSRPAPASSPNAGWQSCHAILVLSLSLSLFLFSNGLSASTRSDRVRPDGVNGARTLDHVPRGEAITLRFWPLMGSAQKFACLIAVLPPCQLGLGGLRCAMEPREGTWSVACQQVPGTSGGSLWLTACRVGA